MSILIKGMEMPKDIVTTINIWADDRHVCILGKEPIILHDAVVELPDHGDLIDADRFFDEFCELCDYEFEARKYVVIPAEKDIK